VHETYDLLEEFLGTSPLAKFSLSGQVVDQDGKPLSGVNMSLSGSQSTQMVTGTNGLFSFDRLATAGEYQVVPKKNHYVFAARSFVRPSSTVVTNFTGTLLRHDISGRVLTSTGTALAGAKVVLSGGQVATTTSDIDGSYRFEDLGGGGNYTITVSRENYSFVVSSRTFTDLSNDVTCDFNGTLLKYKIAGVVKKPDGTPLVGAVVELSNQSTLSKTTDATGNYSFDVNAEANYTVIVRQDPYFFEPSIQTFTFISGNSRADFQALNPVVISGRITTPKGLRLQGVLMSLTGSEVRTTVTDINGDYSFRVRPHGNLTVAATKANYTFNPASTIISDAQADQVVDFKAIVNRGVPVLISGAATPSRALVLDAVLHVPEPFDLHYDQSWSPDNRTRLAIYVENIDLTGADIQTDLIVELENSAGEIYPLLVEQLQIFDGPNSLSSIIVRLHDGINVGGDYRLRVKYRGISSEALLIAMANTQE
jgi:hypothetical protein